MDKLKVWFNQNVDKRQMTTLIVTTAVIGGGAFALSKAGFGKAAKVVKGG